MSVNILGFFFFFYILQELSTIAITFFKEDFRPNFGLKQKGSKLLHLSATMEILVNLYSL